jgi:hypothetical protein
MDLTQDITNKILKSTELDDSAKVMLLFLWNTFGLSGKYFSLSTIEPLFDNDTEILSTYLGLANTLGIITCNERGYLFDSRNWGNLPKRVTLKPLDYYTYDLYKEKESLSKELIGAKVVLDYIKSKVKGYKITKDEKTAASILSNNYPKAAIFKAVDEFIKQAPIKGLGKVTLVNINKNIRNLT